MRQSYVSVVFAAALVFHSYEPSGALPMSKAGAAADGDNNAASSSSSPERDAFASLLGDKAAEIDGDAGADGGQRFIVIATPSLWRDLRALSGGAPPLYKRRANFGGQLPGERADANQDLSLPVPVQRRDMRCMVGRVYRPCWEV